MKICMKCQSLLSGKTIDKKMEMPSASIFTQTTILALSILMSDHTSTALFSFLTVDSLVQSNSGNGK